MTIKSVNCVFGFIGGLVGLFCGMSVLSGFEIIYWFMKYLSGVVVSCRKGSQSQVREEDAKENVIEDANSEFDIREDDEAGE